ncbi:hypothetical protein HJG60_011311 [Phyllostomus discolor]|uniref:Uncharacterized protein n=1 Tax=Phyllostomus discolor TaxID=89673 RepID=A0A834A2D8_9CHIR|nr:hypothetical protein HJG60_011311 [Phyllostomus discolor]
MGLNWDLSWVWVFVVTVVIFSTSQVSNSSGNILCLGLELGWWGIFLSNLFSCFNHPLLHHRRTHCPRSCSSPSGGVLLSACEAHCRCREVLFLLRSSLGLRQALCAWASELGISQHSCPSSLDEPMSAFHLWCSSHQTGFPSPLEH